MALILDSLEIHNFRGLKELCIDRLGRVNLLTGKNNVGKSSVLEALRLYARPGDASELFDLLAERHEFAQEASYRSSPDASASYPFENLFFGRHPLPSDGWGSGITVGPSDQPEKVLEVTWHPGERLRERSDTGMAEPPPQVSVSPNEPFLFFQLGSLFARVTAADLIPPRRYRQLTRLAVAEEASLIPMVYRGARTDSREKLAMLWDRVALTPLEDDAYAALRIIAPEVERLVMKPLVIGSASRVPFVKLKGQDQSIALRSMGDGIDRLFGIALGMVNAKNGFLLIDEVENGLHYSIQLQLWRLLFSVARRLNIQVFATTHSSDCIRSFDVAARESQEDGVVIRLAQKNDRILVAEFDENELGIAVEGQIEVR